MSNSRNTLEPSPKIMLKTKRIFLKKLLIALVTLPTNLQSLGQIDITAVKVKENRLYYRGRLFIPNLENL